MSFGRLVSGVLALTLRVMVGALGLLVRGVQAMGWPFGNGDRLLGPGSKPPDPTRSSDIADYRGVAAAAELGALRQGELSLGRHVVPGAWLGGGQLRLPLPALRRHCAVLGPSGSGKTHGLILPWMREMLQAGTSVVTVDVKGDLLSRLEADAKAAGARIWYWNVWDSVRSASWNWLYEARDERAVESATRSLLGQPRPNDANPFFYERDYRWLRALIPVARGAYGENARPRDLVSLIGDQAELSHVFRRHPALTVHARDLNDLLSFSRDEHAKAVSSLLNALHLFGTPTVARFTERNDFVLSGIGFRPTLLVIGASLADGRAGEILSGLMLNQLFNVVYARLQGGNRGVPIYFVIDEAPRLKDRIRFEEALAITRSADVGVCLAAQCVTQLGDARQATSILANCATMVVLRGASAHTAQYMAQRLGQRTQRVVTATSQREGRIFETYRPEGRSEQLATVPVLGEREIMFPPGSFTAVAHVSEASAKPFLTDLTRRT